MAIVIIRYILRFIVQCIGMINLWVFICVLEIYLFGRVRGLLNVYFSKKIGKFSYSGQVGGGCLCCISVWFFKLNCFRCFIQFVIVFCSFGKVFWLDLFIFLDIFFFILKWLGFIEKIGKCGFGKVFWCICSRFFISLLFLGFFMWIRQFFKVGWIVLVRFIIVLLVLWI